jgi:transposase
MGNKGEQQSSYPPEIKLEAIRLHFEEGVPHQSIMIKLGITSDVINAWLREYSERRDFSTDLSKSRLTYTPEIKLEAVRLHVEMGLTYKDVMSKLGIVSKAGLRGWVYRYRQGEREFSDLRGLNSTGRGKSDPNDTEERPKTKQLEAKIRRLEMENALLKKVWEELRG